MDGLDCGHYSIYLDIKQVIAPTDYKDIRKKNWKNMKINWHLIQLAFLSLCSLDDCSLKYIQQIYSQILQAR